MTSKNRGKQDSMEKDFKAEKTVDVKKTPKRIAFIKGRTAARVRKEEEDMVMTFPHLVIREIIAFEVMVIVLTVISLLFDAPLEWIANPEHTPNPAKAPWYFLGLQELLHYFPPVVGGVLIPALAVIALVIIPYFRVNIVRERLWKQHHPAQLYGFVAGILVMTIILVWFRVWVVLIPSVLMALLMISASFPFDRGPWRWLIFRTPWSQFFGTIYTWLASRSLAAWIMTWFVIVTVILTVVGTLFRGPGWSWTWPWEGVY